MLGQFGGGRCFTGTLQAGHEDDRGRLRRQIDVADALAHGGHELAVHDGDQQLARLQRAQYFLAQRFILDPGDEIAHHGQRHVGFEQGHAHFAQHVGYVGFGDARLAAQAFNDPGEFVGEGGGHRVPNEKPAPLPTTRRVGG